MNQPIDVALIAALNARLARFPVVPVATARGAIGTRQAGRGRPVVFAHGIGSGAGSWLYQYEQLADDFRMVGWDAPGYGVSTPLAAATPTARDYADALAGLLDALGIGRALVIGQSLGAIMTTSFARHYPDRVAGLLLLDAARGYAHSSEGERAERLKARLDSMDKLGPAGLAAARSANLLGPTAGAEALALVRMNMAELRTEGHAQAARLLATSDLCDDAPHVTAKVAVGCGSEDRVTPEPGVRAIAATFRAASYASLAGLGHACYVDGPDQVNALIRRFAAGLEDWS